MKIHPDSFYPSKSQGEFVKWSELSKDDIKHLIENGHWDGVEVQPVRQEESEGVYDSVEMELIKLVEDDNYKVMQYAETVKKLKERYIITPKQNNS